MARDCGLPAPLYRGASPLLLEAALYAFFDQDLCRDLFHREMGGVDVGDVFAAEQVLYLAYFKLALGKA
ncbi:hypothetical protein D3C77_724450 [compost metagenome]